MAQAAGRVSICSARKANKNIAENIIQNIARYKGASSEKLGKRIAELDKA